jgi:tRNA-dihydrouridine synthase
MQIGSLSKNSRKISANPFSAMVIARTTPMVCGEKKWKILGGFMIARWSLGNPWCFLPDNYEPTWQERIGVMEKHMEYMVSSKWENRACLEIRKHFTHYLHGFEWVREFRKKLSMTTSVQETHKILEELRILSVVDFETSH